MQMFNRPSPLGVRLGTLAAIAVLSAPLATALSAQEAQSPSVAPLAAESSPSHSLALRASLDKPLDLTAGAAAFSSSSSSSSSDALPSGPVALMADPAPGTDANMQPPPYRRRRYGRPSYNDRWHNADGSNRLAFVVGGGFNVPVNNSVSVPVYDASGVQTGSTNTDPLKTSWRFEGGVGINFNQKLAVIAQFDYDKFGLPGSILANQEALYTNLTGDTSGSFTGLDGGTHIWSLTLNPTFSFHQGEKVGAYAVVGGGFYHKVTNFTVPSLGTYCDYYGYCYQYQANQTIDFYTSNAPGLTGGLGMTYKFSRFANQKFFAEARYVHTFNSARAGDPSVTGNPNGTLYNFYPPNSNETSWLPITLGIRF